MLKLSRGRGLAMVQRFSCEALATTYKTTPVVNKRKSFKNSNGGLQCYYIIQHTKAATRETSAIRAQKIMATMLTSTKRLTRLKFKRLPLKTFSSTENESYVGQAKPAALRLRTQIDLMSLARLGRL